MKILKFNESNWDNSEYYKKMNLIEYEDMSIEKDISISIGEYEQIIDFLYIDIYKKRYSIELIKDRYKYSSKGYKIYGHFIEIRKRSDDWRMIYIDNSGSRSLGELYLKCDQIDGVIKAIEDNYSPFQ